MRLAKVHSVFNPLWMGWRIGPIGGLSADSNVSPQKERRKEKRKKE